MGGRDVHDGRRFLAGQDATTGGFPRHLRARGFADVGPVFSRHLLWHGTRFPRQQRDRGSAELVHVPWQPFTAHHEYRGQLDDGHRPGISFPAVGRVFIVPVFLPEGLQPKTADAGFSGVGDSRSHAVATSGSPAARLAFSGSLLHAVRRRGIDLAGGCDVEKDCRRAPAGRHPCRHNFIDRRWLSCQHDLRLARRHCPGERSPGGICSGLHSGSHPT